MNLSHNTRSWATLEIQNVALNDFVSMHIKAELWWWLGCYVKQTNNQQQQQQKPVIWKIWGSFRGHRAAVHPVAVRGRNSCQPKDVSDRTGVQNRAFLIQIEVVWRNGGLTPLVVSRTDNRQKTQKVLKLKQILQIMSRASAWLLMHVLLPGLHHGAFLCFYWQSAFLCIEDPLFWCRCDCGTRTHVCCK